METTRSRVSKLLLAVAAAAAMPGLLLAQDNEAVPGRTIVARFSIPEDAFEGVTSSVELVQALRDYLTIDLAMPLDEPLRVGFRGVAGARNAEGPPYIFQLSSMGVGYAGQEPLTNFPYALAVRESHGDDWSDDRDEWAELDSFDGAAWDEETAWNWVVKALDIGPPQSSGAFARPAAGGHVGLRVAEMHVREFTVGPENKDIDGWNAFFDCCSYDFEGAVLEIRPDISHPSMMAGEVPDDVRYRLNVIVLELEPGTPGDEVAAGAAGAGAGVAGDAAALSAEDAKALEIAESFVFACDPSELKAAVDVSASIVTLDGEQRIGQAVYWVEGDGNLFVVLGKMDEQPPYCLVLMSPGGPAELGTYEVLALSNLPESEREFEEREFEERPFIAALIGEETTFVTETGTVEIRTVEGRSEGTFDLEGWTMSDAGRRDGVKVTGGFNALKVDD